MIDKNLYINDLLHRFPGHTFEEIPESDFTRVNFRDADSNLVWSTKNLEVIDAYRNIRSNLLDALEPMFLSSTEERDALADTEMGLPIFNLFIDSIDSFNGANWKTSTPPNAFGEMFEDNSSGSEIDSSSKTWVSATAGLFDSNSLVSFLDDPDGDSLVIGEGGDGTYKINYKCNFTNEGSNNTTSSLLKNDVVQSNFTDLRAGDSAEPRTLLGSGFLELVETDALKLHIVSDTASDVVRVFQVNFNIERIN